MDMDSTIRAESNFRHFSNSLKKRGFIYAAGYVAAVGTASTTTTAADVWRNTKDATALQQMLAFFRGVCDNVPSAIETAYRIAHATRSYTASERIELVHKHVPDPFALIDGESIVTVELTRAEARELRDAIGRTDNTAVRARAFSKVKAAAS